MADDRIDIQELIDALLEDLGGRPLREEVSFSERAYGAQPILETGRQLQERRAAERAERRAVDVGAREREAARQEQRHAARATRLARRQGASRRGGLGRVDGLPAGEVNGGDLAWMYEYDKGADASRARESAGADIPDRYHELRALAKDGDHWSLVSPRLFYEQARLMADFEDDCRISASFSHYYPTYAVMDIMQLRTYFTWRTKVRAGIVERTSPSYAFVYVYELLCGVGTTAGRQGYADIVAFWHAFSPHAYGTSFDALLRRWTYDYAIYHDIADVLEPSSRPAAITGAGGRRSAGEGSASGPAGAARGKTALSHGDAIMRLVDAEAAVLERAGRARKLATAADTAAAPSADEVFEALATVSRYHIERSRFARDRHDDLAAIVSAVFAELVIHCSRRRKTDFVEGLFGAARDEPYTMYPSAVFYDPAPPADGTVVRAGRAESYRCVRGRWFRSRAYRRDETSQELGVVLRATDSHAREAFGFGYPIKVLKTPPAYVLRIIDRAIEDRVRKRREEEARRITFDMGKLRGIRAAAATTREALLVDEEREEIACQGTNAYAVDGTDCSIEQNKVIDNSKKVVPILGTHDIIQTDVTSFTDAGGASDGFGQTERTVLKALLEGDAQRALQAATEGGKMASLVIDGINDRLFDVIGDAAIEFEGDMPVLVADYEQDVREVLGDE